MVLAEVVALVSVLFRPVLVTTYWLLPPAMFGTVNVPFVACKRDSSLNHCYSCLVQHAFPD